MRGFFCSAVSPLNTTVLTIPDTQRGTKREHEFQEKLAHRPEKAAAAQRAIFKTSFDLLLILLLCPACERRALGKVTF